MLSPIIKEPVFECTEFIRVYSVEAGSKIIVRSGNNEIGESEAKGGSVIVKLKSPLSSGERIAAVAVKKSDKSNPSDPVKVQQLPPLSPPLTETTLYEGAICIHAWGLIPGSTVRAWNGTDLLGRGIAYDSFIRLPLNRPLTGGDAVRLDAEICRNKSAKTAQIVPIMPYGSGPYAEKLPPPTVKEPLMACQRVVGVKGLLPGARIKIFADNTTGYDQCAPTIDGSFLLGPELKENQLVTAQQSFDSLNLKSDLSDSIRVGSPKNLTAPMIHEPVFEGDRSVFVFNLLNSVKVEIAVDGKSIGCADYDSDYEFGLGYKLKAGQRIKARQGLCGNWGQWSKEVIVQPSPKRVPPPKLEEPLYPCANMVRITDKLEGSLVKVYANSVFIGKGKLLVINVTPHLVAKQKITATQTAGNITSKHSQPVVVKDMPPDLPAPKLEDPIDSCSSYVTVSNLLPGIRVNIFWNKLLIGATEALDKIALVSVAPQPWPGTKIHANQSMCMLKSSDSNKTTVVGELTFPNNCLLGSSHIQNPWFIAMLGDSLKIKVATMCPVKTDTKLIITSSDSKVLKVQGPSESIIHKGKQETTFALATVSPGEVKLEITADHYKKAYDERRGKKAYKIHVLGRITVNPSKKIIKVGDTFDLKVVSIDPMPLDRKVGFQSQFPSQVEVVPTSITIPVGKTSTSVKVKGTSVSNYIYVLVSANRPYYSSGECDVRVDPAPKKPKKPKVKQKTYKLLLQWQAPYTGKVYVMGKVYPVPNGKLKKVRNINTNSPWRYNLWFPKYPHTTDDAFDPKKGYLLKYGEEATPSQLGLPESMDNGLWIGATPSFVDSYQKGQVYVELHYEIHK